MAANAPATTRAIVSRADDLPPLCDRDDHIFHGIQNRHAKDGMYALNDHNPLLSDRYSGLKKRWGFRLNIHRKFRIKFPVHQTLCVGLPISTGLAYAGSAGIEFFLCLILIPDGKSIKDTTNSFAMRFAEAGKP